ncbi:hypothetical protein [Massilia sp. Leaf139]|uniref:hypothetical protein n=1 Tax=Massilia sp. Leaf139 TaxID=1736272 RepID=UPI0006F64F57|nr:hypothetical protein [Massilia sp. Leaf139]KQQ88388.1 hypothetical protein ASF77_12005 [Massilia sp. Leaf139]
MNTIMQLQPAATMAMVELDEHEITHISGGHPAVIATTAVIALGSAALDMGYKLGGMLYKAMH